MPNNDNYEYMKFLDLTGAQQIWNTCKQTFVQTVNGVGIDANGNVNTSGVNFPVGYIYLTTDNSTSPASLFGGTWTQIKDVFLLGAGDTYTAGDTGGSATHTLLQSELPATLNFKIATSSSGSSPYGSILMYGDLYADRADRNYILANENGGQAHNNMPPYLVVYMWKRVS